VRVIQSDAVCAARHRFFHFCPILIVEVGRLPIAANVQAQHGCVGLRYQYLDVGWIGRPQPGARPVEIADRRREPDPSSWHRTDGIDPAQKACHVQPAWALQKRKQFVDQDEICRSEEADLPEPTSPALREMLRESTVTPQQRRG
jgi:hypothetical protein